VTGLRWNLSIQRRYQVKRLVLALALSVLLLPLKAVAQNEFDGTWKFDLSKVAFSQKPDVMILADGIYECKTCVPSVKVKADGSDQVVTGDPYSDKMAVTVVSDHEIKLVTKKGGKVALEGTSTVSQDGRTKSDTLKVYPPSGPPVTGKGQSKRVVDGPGGSHAISGSWVTDKVQSMSDDAITLNYKVTGDAITMMNKTGESYTAKMDGSEVPYTGDPGVTTISVKLLGSRTLEETRRKDGKVIGVWTMTVSEDGKKAHGKAYDAQRDATDEFELINQ
jgi:hypothetical protein